MATFVDPGIGAYASAAQTGLQFVGQLLAASSAKKVADYNARLAEANAEQAAQAARMEALQHRRAMETAVQDIYLLRQAQQWQEQNQRRQQAALLADSEAMIAASGLLMTGSPLAQWESTALAMERDLMAGRYQAALQERALWAGRTQEAFAAERAEYGAGERLRIGRAAGAVARYTGGQQQFAHLLGAVGTVGEGAARTWTARELAPAPARQPREGLEALW
jgi:hypothetical protein